MESQEFPHISEQEWLDKIKKELKISDISEISTKHGFAINPLLRTEIEQPIVERKSNIWKFGLTIELTDAESFNARIREYLGWGMNAVYVQVTGRNIDFEKAFEDVYLEMIYPIFSVEDQESLEHLTTFLKTKKHNEVGLDTNIESIDNQVFAHQIQSTKVSNKMIQAISEIRSLRKPPYSIDTHKVVAYIGCTKDSAYHPLIELTCQSVAAVTGGADIIIVDSKSIPDPEKLNRLALNIHHILQMESNLQWVDDPLKGSYLIEQLTS